MSCSSLSVSQVSNPIPASTRSTPCVTGRQPGQAAGAEPALPAPWVRARQELSPQGWHMPTAVPAGSDTGREQGRGHGGGRRAGPGYGVGVSEAEAGLRGTGVSSSPRGAGRPGTRGPCVCGASAVRSDGSREGTLGALSKGRREAHGEKQFTPPQRGSGGRGPGPAPWKVGSDHSDLRHQVNACEARGVGDCPVVKQLGLGLSRTRSEMRPSTCRPAPGVAQPAHPAAAGPGGRVSPKPRSPLRGAEQACCAGRRGLDPKTACPV